MHFVADFSVGRSATTFPPAEHTPLNVVAEVCTSISADGAGRGVEKMKETGKEKTRAMFSKSVVFGWEILKYRNILHLAWNVQTLELCMVVFQLSFTLL